MDKGRGTSNSTQLTIFSVPKPFSGHAGIIQRNAVKSWSLLSPRPRIFLFGNEAGIAEVCEDLDLTHLPSVQCNSVGTPCLSHVFATVELQSDTKLLLFVNADVILFNDVYSVIRSCLDRFDQFLVIGRRTELQVNDLVPFADTCWEKNLRKVADQQGFLQRPSHKDYFLFTMGLWRNMPDFAVGRASYDNALVQHAVDRKVPVIDATYAVTAIHQTHGYGHIKGGQQEAYKGREAQNNYELAKKWLGKSVVKQGYIDQTSFLFDLDGQIVLRKKDKFVDEFLQLDFALKKKGWKHKYDLYAPKFAYVKKLNNISNPKISVILVTWRLHPDTLQNLQIINKQRATPIELILVNNGAQEQELAELEPYVDIYVKLKDNTGPCFARNVGAVFSTAPLLFFLEDDGIPAENIIKSHLRAFEIYDIIALRGVYTPKTVDNPFNKLAKHYHLGDRSFPMHLNLEGNTSVKSKPFFKVNGWDEDIFIMEDGLALTMRLLDLDPCMLRQIYYPEAVIYHDYARDEEHLESKLAWKKKSLEVIKNKYRDYQRVKEIYRKLRFRDDLVQGLGYNNMSVIEDYNIKVILEKEKKEHGLSIVIVHENSPADLDSLISKLLKVNTIQPLELVIIDFSLNSETSRLLIRHAQDVFVRLISMPSSDDLCPDRGMEKTRYAKQLVISTAAAHPSENIAFALDHISKQEKAEARLDMDDFALIKSACSSLSSNKSNHFHFKKNEGSSSTKESMIVRAGNPRLLKKDQIDINWKITSRCNYACSYCTVKKDNVHLIPLEKLKTAADNLCSLKNSHIKIILTGGEPTILPSYKDFLEYLLTMDSKRVSVTTITNLSLPLSFYQRLASSKFIIKEKAGFVSSFHMEYARADKFIANAKYLSDSGFEVYLWLIAHPDRMKEIRNLYEEFRNYSSDRLKIDVKLVRENFGPLPDKRYSKADLGWLSRHYNEDSDKNIAVDVLDTKSRSVERNFYVPNEVIARGLNRFKGMICHAGTKMISIDPHGNIAPAVCFRSKKQEGPNIYDPNGLPDDFAKPVKCPFDACGCLADLPLPKYLPGYENFEIDTQNE
jgi:MoaA/NifB/PqqE/SkfB family radical SAM enzyme/GT2 family glycosyltransferase